MNAVRKRPQLDPSRPPITIATSRGLLPTSHDAPRLPPHTPDSGGGTRGEEEEEELLLVEEDTTDSSLIITMEDSQVQQVSRRRSNRKRKTMGEDEEEEEKVEELEELEELIDRQLDQSLETKSRQHNLTTVNVKNILHEVITNEHVVAMMKAAINQTEAVPPFEPKMTRSKFKEVVERGVVIPAWNISPIKKSSETYKGPQFVDIPLEEEDSSDEEYRPDEEDEDETAEETLLDSDLDSSASSPRGSRLNRPEEDSSSPWQSSRSHSRIGSVLMGPPPPPKALPPKAAPDSSFLEKLHAVEEELDGCIRTYQTLSESQEGASLMAYRTRSKRPLRDVPLDLLEAELRAPDITPDMYDSGSTHQDREWTDWLRGLMTTHIDNEEEGDDEDDPEYNFLAETDEPDVEDYRDDKAVRITKKEVNELMEELFETLKEDLAGQEAEDEGREEEEEHQEETFTLHTHTQEDTHSTGRCLQEQARDGPITGLQTVKQQLVFLRRAEQAQPLQRTHPAETLTLRLQAQQRLRLQQQLQQHVQLLTQTHLLSSPVAKLQSEAETTRHFLVELELLAGRTELLMSSSCPGFCSAFRASNLQEALQLLEELQKNPIGYRPQPRPPDARGYMRSHPSLPPQLAWIFSTRPVFLYPELLPLVSLDPELYCPRRTQAFTAAEDCLLVLGLRNLQGCQDPPRLLSQLLLRKSLLQLRRRLLQCCRPGGPDNMVKAFRYQRVLWPMPVACRPVAPADQRPPVERDEQLLPLWLVRSLPIIHQVVRSFSGMSGGVSQQRRCSSSAHYSRFPPGTRYPPRLPPSLDFRRGGFVLRQPLPPPPPQDQPTSDGCSSSISSTSTQLITRHHHTLASLRGRSHNRGWREETAEEQEEQQEQDGDDVITGVEKEEEVEQEEVEQEVEQEEEQEEASEVFLTLSESSSCSSSSEEEESESEQEVMSEAEAPAEQEEEQEEDQLFAKDYLLRVCEVLQVQPGLLEQLLLLLDQFVAAGPLEAPELLHQGLTELLQPWPQLLIRFAAFLSPAQARRCGLQWEQQQFQRSRRFLLRVGRSLGRSSALYRQLVSLLQGSPAPSAQDLHQVSSLLEEHADLQQEFWENFQPQQPPDWPRVKGVEPGAPLGANNVLLSASGARVLVWTREADRAILTACQQMGANQKTFRHIAAQLGDKTTQQVSLRFQDLMKLFHSSSCSSSSLHKA